MFGLLSFFQQRFTHIDRALAAQDQKETAILAALQRIESRQKQDLEQLTAQLQTVIDLLTIPEAIEIRFNATLDGNTFEGVTHMIITDTQKFTLTLDPRDAKGNAATLDGPATFTSSNPDVLTVTASEDGLSAEVLAVGPLGTGQISVVADALIGDGVKEITGVLDVEVKAGEAVSLTLNTSAPTEQ